MRGKRHLCRPLVAGCPNRLLIKRSWSSWEFLHKSMIDCPVVVVIVFCPPTLLTRIVDEEDNLKLDSTLISFCGSLQQRWLQTCCSTLQCQELPEEVPPERLTTSVSPLNMLPAIEIYNNKKKKNHLKSCLHHFTRRSKVPRVWRICHCGLQ